METNFFEKIATLDIKGDLQITIRQQQCGLVVSTLLKNDSCGDNARSVIPPLILKGTAQEIDAGFFANITAPLQTTSALFINMESYMKAQETAHQQSKMEQQKASKETKAQDDKKKKYEAAIKKPEELAKEGKYREAWAKYPEPSDHPGYAETIRKRRTELAAKFAPDLFAAAETQSVQISAFSNDKPEHEEDSREDTEGYETEDEEENEESFI